MGSLRVRDELAGVGHHAHRMWAASDAKDARAGPVSAVWSRRSARRQKSFPYRLNDLKIDHTNPVWSTDITCISMANDSMNLVAIIDWYSLRILSRWVSSAMEKCFRIEALEEVIQRFGGSVIFSTDEAAQSTSEAITGVLKDESIAISMEDKGRRLGNVFVERLWCNVKYKCASLRAYESSAELGAGLAH